MTAIPQAAPAYGSPSWQAERRSFVQASDVPMIMGVSPFGGAYDVWLEKRGLAPAIESEVMRWGHYHEPNIAREYARRFPDVQLEEVGTLPHPKYPWFRATVDRLVHGPHGTFPLEIKSTSAYLGDRWGDEGTDAIPDHVLVQAQVQLMVLAKSLAHVAVLIGGNDFRAPYLAEADAELQEMILERVHEFYQRHVVRGDEPAIDGPNIEAHLKRKYQTHTRDVLTASEAQAAVITEYLEVRDIRKGAETREGELKPQIMTMIGGNYGIECATGRILWCEAKGRSSLDSKGLIEHLKVPQDVLNQFTRTGAPSRSFRAFPRGEQ